MKAVSASATRVAISVLFLYLSIGASAAYPSVPNATLARGFVAELWLSGVKNPRTLLYDGDSDSVLVLVRGTDSILSLKENKEGTQVQVTKLLDNSTLNLNHGLALHKKYIYASSASAVYRWPYKANEPITAKYEVVVKDIPTVPGPPEKEAGRTRTLLFKGDIMYLAIGARLNVDPDPDRSRIVTFDLGSKIPAGGWSWKDAKKFVSGLRNTVGITVDGMGRIWGADCGGDRLVRQDLGADLEQDNPAEEINLLEEGRFYGYPQCFTAWNVPNASKPSDNQQLQQFIWPDALPDFKQTYTDEWCRQVKNNNPPATGLAGHSVPIGLSFYDGKGCGKNGGFDCWMKGDAFIAMRGSWDKKVPNGFQVARLPFPNGKPSTSPVIPLIWHTDYQKNCVAEDQKATCLRMVSAIFTPSGKMLIAVDIADGMILRLSRDGDVKLSSDKAGSAAVVTKAGAALWATLVVAAGLFVL